MATKTTKKSGRPERSKTSYANEIQRLKKRIKDLEVDKTFLVLQLEGLMDRTNKFYTQPLLDRIKYIIKGA